MSAVIKEKTGVPDMEHLNEFSEFLDRELKENGVSAKTAVKLRVAVDEIYSNICYYSGAREVTLGIRLTEGREGKDRNVILYFVDDGVSYDPLKRKDPDVTLPLEKRNRKGGLGIYMVKKMMDWVTYEHINGKNCLTMGLGENDEVE